MFFHAIFNDWLENAPCRVVNRTEPMGSNLSKPNQAQMIRQPLRLLVPPTLVTNDARGCGSLLGSMGG